MTIDTVAIKKVARAELLKRVLIIITAIFVAIILVLVLVTLDAIRSTQQQGSPTLRAIKEQQDDIETAATSASSLNQLILGCFDPESECAKETAAQEAERAGAYNAAVIAAQFCVDRKLPADYTLHELTACVGAILEAKGHQ